MSAPSPLDVDRLARALVALLAAWWERQAAARGERAASGAGDRGLGQGTG